MLWPTRLHWSFVVGLLQLYSALGKDLLLPRCVEILSINTPVDDPVRAAENYGVKASRKRAVLSNSPGIFRIHKGLTEENGTVSLEALYHPRYFLRHKNYHFHLEKEFNNSMFRKDSTFYILKVTENPPLYAFEMYSHPTWFMRHAKHKPYKLALKKVNEASKEVMDSTFYLEPKRCTSMKKDISAVKKAVLVGDGTFIDTADEEAADIASAKANDLHVEAFEKNYEKLEEANDDSIQIHTEDDETDDQQPIRIHTETDLEPSNSTSPPQAPAPGKGGAEESSDEILSEIEQAFRIAQRGNNTSYLEKIEKDIEDKVNKIAASATDSKTKPPSDSNKASDAGKEKNVDDIEIHTEADESPTKEENRGDTEIHTETDSPLRKKEKSSIDRVSKLKKGRKQPRVEVLGPVIETGEIQAGEPYIEGVRIPNEIDKDIVVTGKPKLNGNVVIDSTYDGKPDEKAQRNESLHQETLTGFSIDDVRKKKMNATASNAGVKLANPLQIKHPKSYHDYSEGHNIENLRKVLKAIEDVPAGNLKEHGIEMVNQTKVGSNGYLASRTANVTSAMQPQGNASTSALYPNGIPLVNKIPPYLPQLPFNYHVLKSQSSAQTSVTSLPAAVLPQQRPGVAVFASPPPQLNKDASVMTPMSTTSAPGLHVVQSGGSAPIANASAQGTVDLPDRFHAELVDNGASNYPISHSAPLHPLSNSGQVRDNGVHSLISHFVADLHPRNKSLAETFKELTPEDTAKIFYLGECKDEFPRACEDWAAKRYCLTFSELMKRYCKKACKLCNHVLATAFTPCDRTCGGGVRLRMIKVNNRQVLQRRSCNVNSCPVNGGYTPYSDWSECSVTCGEGVRYRHRSCTSPKPQFGGFDCSHLGPPVDTVPCFKSCKDFKGGRPRNYDKSGAKKHKHHSSDHSDPDAFPEYTAEESNPKTTESVGESNTYISNEERLEAGSANQLSESGSEFKWPNKHHRTKPVILHHVHKNVFKHKDHHGNHHLLHIDEDKHPFEEEHPFYDQSLEGQIHTHVVRYKGQQVAKMECGPSQLLQYHKHEANNPTGYRRSPSYRMFDAGQIVYDKYGLPTDTTKNIVQAFDSPYKIILQRNKNNQMKILEQCIESDASVNPENDLKAGQFTNYGSIPLEGEQRSLTSSSRLPPDRAMSNRYAANGLYEYKYEDIGQGYGENDKPLAVDKDVQDQLLKAYKSEAAELNERSMRNREPKPTLREQLAVERDEALREKSYEDMIAKKSKFPNSR